MSWADNIQLIRRKPQEHEEPKRPKTEGELLDDETEDVNKTWFAIISSVIIVAVFLYLWWLSTLR
jgi:hypothetical protein